MSVKIRVSYTEEDELRGLLWTIPHGRVKRRNKGRYRLAYIEVKGEDLRAIFATKNANETV